MLKEFTIICPVNLFPSDNELDSMPRQKRISIKKTIKTQAFALTVEWFQKNKLKRWAYKPAAPFLTRQASLTLTLYYSDEKERDMPNISMKHFLDEVKDLGIIADDSYKYIKWCKTEFGGLVKDSYAVFTLREIE